MGLLENVVPIVLIGAKAFDRWVAGHHLVSHVIAHGVRIESAEDFISLIEKQGDPGRIGSGAGSGDAKRAGMEHQTADGIDGGFAQDDRRSAGGRYRKEAEVSLGTGSHATPARA